MTSLPESTVTEIFKRIRPTEAIINGISIVPDIDSEPLANARLACEIPTNETVFVLVDTHRKRNGKQGMVFTDAALYYTNPSFARTQKGRIPYDELASCIVQKHGFGTISFGGLHIIDVSLPSTRDMFIDIFQRFVCLVAGKDESMADPFHGICCPQCGKTELAFWHRSLGARAAQGIGSLFIRGAVTALTGSDVLGTAAAMPDAMNALQGADGICCKACNMSKEIDAVAFIKAKRSAIFSPAPQPLTEEEKAEQERDVQQTAFTFSCPHCSQHISATPDFIGTDASCPTCNNAFVVPANNA